MVKQGGNPNKAVLGKHRPLWAWWVIVAIVLFSAIIRYGLLDVPLERDEGEYAYAGQLILQGLLPYQDLYNMKLPGIYAVYAIMLSIFGQTHTGIHWGLLIVNAATIIMVFLLTRRLTDTLAGLVAGACFAVLSAGQCVQGVFANAEHFVILPATGGLILLLRAMDEDRPLFFFFSGLLLGTGFLIKQHGGAFVALGGMYLIVDQLSRRPLKWPRLFRRCVIFVFGALSPYCVTCLIFISAGAFDEFWFWTVDYARAYTSQVPVENAWDMFNPKALEILGAAPLVWALAGLGVSSIFWIKQDRKRWIFLSMFACFSFLAICPGFFFRPHYFVLLLPVSAVFAGVGTSALTDVISKGRSGIMQYMVPVGLVGMCLTFTIYQQRDFLFLMSPVQACRFTYQLNPFPESLKISRFIRDNTKQDDRIAILGSEPQIFFYSGRRSATGFIYMYPLMEEHDYALEMQKRMIREIETARPEILAFVRIGSSWLQHKCSHELLFDWFREYHKAHYIPAGLVEIFKDRSLYHWVPDMRWPPRSPLWILLLKRKDHDI